MLIIAGRQLIVLSSSQGIKMMGCQVVKKPVIFFDIAAEWQTTLVWLSSSNQNDSSLYHWQQSAVRQICYVDQKTAGETICNQICRCLAANQVMTTSTSWCLLSVSTSLSTDQQLAFAYRRSHCLVTLIARSRCLAGDTQSATWLTTVKMAAIKTNQITAFVSIFIIAWKMLQQ